MSLPDWLSDADKVGSVVGGAAGVVSLVVAFGRRRAGGTDAGEPRPVVDPLRWRWVAVGAAAVLAAVPPAAGAVTGLWRWVFSGAAVVLGVAAAVRLVTLAVRPMVPDQALRRLLRRQWEDANRHAYQFFDGHPPAVPKIYVEQRVEASGAALPTGQARVAGLLTVREVLAQERVFRHVLIVSGPGMGKSTLVAQILYEQCRWWLDARRGSRLADAPFGAVVPVALPARLLARGSLTEALAEVCGSPDDGLADRICGEPPASGAAWLILVDGLDEVLDRDERSSMINRLGGWLTEATADRRFLITTRPLSTGELAEVRPHGVGEFSIQAFSGPDLRFFAGNWFACRAARHEAETLAALFLARVSSARLGAVVSVPLLATIAVLVFEADRDAGLPTSRAALYERFVDHLLNGRRAVREQRDRLRRIFERYGPDSRRAWEWLDSDRRPLLEYLADSYLRGDDGRLAARAQDWVTNQPPGAPITAVPGWRAHVLTMLTSTGVLTLHRDRLEFSHRSLAEYLAAPARGGSFDRAAWFTDVRNPDTRNLALFVLAHSTEDVDGLVQNLLDALGENVIAAGDVLADGIDVAPGQRQRVVEALFAQLCDEDRTAPEALRVLVDLSGADGVRDRLAALVGQEQARPWVRVLVADALDQRDGNGGARLRSLAGNASLAPDARRWAAEQVRWLGDDVQPQPPPAAVGDPAGPVTAGVLALHALRRVHENRRGGSDYELVAALSLADAGEPDAGDALYACLTEPARRVDLRLEAARVLLRIDGGRRAGALASIAGDAELPVDVRAPVAVALAERGNDIGRQVLEALVVAHPTIDELLFAVGPAATTSDPASVGPDAPEVVRIWGGVPLRNPDFTGREPLLRRMRQNLESRTMWDWPPRILHGLNGVGKTQLAVEYAYRHADRYDIVWWIPAEQRSLVLRSLSELGRRLGVPETGDLEHAARAALQSQPVTERRWLLVYDNVAERGDVAGLVPFVGADVILTSNSPKLAARGSWDAIEVDVFTRRESVELIRKRSGGIGQADAERLADRLGDMPLSLDQAASWHAATGMPVPEILGLFDAHVARLAAEGRPTSYPVSVAAFVRLALDRLAADAPAIAELVALFAFLGAAPVPVALLRRGRDASISEPLKQTLRDPVALSRAIRQLRRSGLARVDADQRVQVHGLSQLVLREWLGDERARQTRDNVRAILTRANPGRPDDPAAWSLHAEVVPHVMAADLVGADDVETRRVVVDQIRYLGNIGDSEGSCRLAEAAVQAWTRAAGDPDLSPAGELTLVATRHLANTLRSLGEYERARDLDQDALDGLRHAFGEDHAQTLEAAGSVAVDLLIAGDLDGALALAGDTAVRSRRAFGDEEPQTLDARGVLAASLRMSGDFALAHRIDEDLAHAWSTIVGKDHPRTLGVHTCLAHDLYGLGRYAESLELGRRTLPVIRERLGPGHRGALVAARTTAMALRKTGAYAEALSAARDIHVDRTVPMAPDHEHALAATMTYANVLRAAGELEKAGEFATDAVDRCHRTFGKIHPLSLAATNNLAIILRAQGERREARALDEVTYETAKVALGAQHPLTLCAANGLANDLALAGESTRAQRLSERTFAASRGSRGRRHPDTLACAVNAALDRRDTGDREAGRALLERAVAALGEVLGPDHPETLAAARGERAECDVEPPPI